MRWKRVPALLAQSGNGNHCRGTGKTLNSPEKGKVLGPSKVRIRIDQLNGGFSRNFEELGILDEVGDLEIQVAMLLGSCHFARPTQS